MKFNEFKQQVGVAFPTINLTCDYDPDRDCYVAADAGLNILINYSAGTYTLYTKNSVEEYQSLEDYKLSVRTRYE